MRVPTSRPHKDSLNAREVRLIHLQRPPHALPAPRLPNGVLLTAGRRRRRRARDTLNRQAVPARGRLLGRRRAVVEVEVVRCDGLGNERLELGERGGERDVERWDLGGWVFES